jgi:hypothetical protein
LAENEALFQEKRQMIIGYLSLASAAFLIAFTVKRGRLVLHKLAINSVGLLNVMLKQTDEDTHIKNVEQATTKLLFSLLKTIALFAVGILLSFFPMGILYSIDPEVYGNLKLQSFYSIAAISIGATIPFFIPSKRNKLNSYSELQQLLHYLVLENFEIGKKLFAIEKKSQSTEPTHNVKQFVIVSGLARAGTTSLMNKLAVYDIFATLSYANMPLLMAPNLWRKFYNPKTKTVKERSHKDGIRIGLNSNEALEEYFFKAITTDRFIAENKLLVHELSADEYEQYLAYQNVIRQKESQFYLAKNNNFLLRYKSFRVLNDSFVMVIMFREPLTHALSLLDKHQSFSALQKEDPFVLDYMNWLGHHEFGINHMPFEFENHSETNSFSLHDINYWIMVWINYYEYAIQSNHPNTIFICYEEYCANPSIAVNSIFKKLALPAPPSNDLPFTNRRDNRIDCNAELFERAQSIYKALTELT